MQFIKLRMTTGGECYIRLGAINAVADVLSGDGCLVWVQGDQKAFQIALPKEECIKRMRDLYERGD